MARMQVTGYAVWGICGAIPCRPVQNCTNLIHLTNILNSNFLYAILADVAISVYFIGLVIIRLINQPLPDIHCQFAVYSPFTFIVSYTEITSV